MIELPVEHRAARQALLERLQSDYATKGNIPLCGLIVTATDVLCVEAPVVESDLHKETFIALMRVKSIELNAMISAIAFEAWGAEAKTPEDRKEIAKLDSEGRSLSEFSGAFERCMLIVEDDHGQSQSFYKLLRHHQAMVELSQEHQTFAGWNDIANRGRMSGFFVPKAARDAPDVQAWCKQMGSLFGSIAEAQTEPGSPQSH